MHVKMTLFREDGSPQDIEVTAEPTATVRDVAARIAASDPRHGYDPARRYTLQTASPIDPEWRLLPPDAVIGDEWLASGTSVALVDEEYAAGILPSLAGGTTATVTVLNGPQAGRTEVLGRGSHTVGRDASADLTIPDPYLSKRHFRVDVGAQVDVVDLGSANGVEVAGDLVSRLRVSGSVEILAGDTELRIDVQVREAAQRDDHVGPVDFNRSPRVEERYNGRDFAVPEVPREPDEQPFPLLAMIAPILLGGAMFMLTQRPITLLFIAMTPVMMVGAYITNKRRDKRKLAKQIARFDSGLEDLAARLEAEKVVEKTRRIAEIPSAADVLGAATELGPLVWTRRPEHWNFLSLRLGAAPMPSRNTVDTEQRGDLLLEFQERLDAVIDAHRLVDDVPVVVELGEAGALGFAGPAPRVHEAAAAAIAQVAGLHSPAEVVIAAALSPEWAQRLDWLKWLPHTASPHSPLRASHLTATQPAAAALLDAVEELVSQRAREKARRRDQGRGALSLEASSLQAGAEVGAGGAADRVEPPPIPAIVLVVSGDAVRDRARLVDLAERGADVGVFPIWLADEPAQVPAVCRVFVDLTAFDPDADDAPARVGFVRLGETFEVSRLDRVDPREAEGFARSLSRVVDANVPIDDVSDLPRSVSLANLIDPELLREPDTAVERWFANESIVDRSGAAPVRRRAGRLRATVGQSAGGVMHLDLRTHGPHALVGGTTGSGKSEFLQAWVLGMAAEYSPDRVTFLFVDYKGGSAFADCIELPHAVGMVTDLTPHLVRRALTSLRAELHHREELLNRKGAKDLLELEKRGDPEAPPALVLIIDEFAALVGEVPEFVDGVVDIAQRGRSLGIHLIMATQRPAGVIRDNLRANTNLRIALRMADESDSQDVIGEKDAAHFDPGTPGRGIAKTGPGRLERFQSGYAGGWSDTEPESARVTIADMPFGVGAEWVAPSDDDRPEERDLGPNDQKRMVQVIGEAARRAKIPAPRRPWLDELPTALDLTRLRSRTDAALPLGLADLPEKQAQQVVSFQPDTDGSLAVFGTGGTGKTTVLRTLAASAALAHRSHVQVYGLDFGTGGLKALQALPTVGAVISGDDTERVVRLLRMLRTESERRSRVYSDAQASTLSDYRQQPGNEDEPRILLLVDNFPGFRDDWEIPAGRSEWFRAFADLIALGRPLGIHVVLTADRPGSLPSTIASGLPRRVVLRLADDAGYSLLDLPKDVLDENSPPGRALFGAAETQIAILGGDPAASAQAEALAALGAQLTERGVTPTPPIAALPELVELVGLPEPGPGAPWTIGVAEETLAPFAIEPVGPFVVSGPPGSGRSTALATIAQRAFQSGRPTYYFGPRRSALAADDRWTATAHTAEDAASLAQLVTEIVADPDAQDRVVVVIEAIGDFLQTPADARLVDLVKAIKREEHFAVAEAEASSWVSSWPLFGEFKSGRRGLLLQPDAADGDIVLKTTLPRTRRAEYPVGRGMVVGGGSGHRVQIAHAG